MLARVEIGIVGRSRGEGRAGSAVAASAYNLSARLSDAAGHAYDYSRKGGDYADGCILLPSSAPPELAEPGALWRAAEAVERRVDAQLARQILITIPREVAAADRLDFARHVIAPYIADGAAAQLDVHCPRAADGNEQPHAHVLLTLRRVTKTGLARTKYRDWNAQFRECGGRAERARIGARATAWLATRGLPEYDLRSLKARGDDRHPEPTAPRQDWQAWLREGRDPAHTPKTVAATLAHRVRRADLIRAEEAEARAASEVADLARALAKAEAKPALFVPPSPRPPTKADRRADAEAAWQMCRSAHGAERTRHEPRADLRTRHSAERDAVYRNMLLRAARAEALARLDRRQSWERTTARADQLTRQWSASPRETLDEWIARQATTGHSAAVAVQASRIRAAVKQAMRDPTGAAIRALDARERAIRAVLATPPQDGAAVWAQAATALARAAERRDAAAQAAARARAEQRAHARAHGFLGLVFGREAVREHARLGTVVVKAQRRAKLAQGDHAEEVAAIRVAAARLAPEADRVYAAWRRGPASNATNELAQVAEARRRLATGIRAPTAAALTPTDPRAVAVRSLAAWEQRHARDPAALARARAVTAAAVWGDARTVAAAAAGDAAGAEAAAAAWQARLEAQQAQSRAARGGQQKQRAKTTFGPR